jgi:hypothetical protein
MKYTPVKSQSYKQLQIDTRIVAERVGGAETPGVQEVLQRIIEMEPHTEFLDLSNQKIHRIEEIEAHLLQLRNLQDLNLEDNLLESLPPDLSLIFSQI